MEHSSDAWFPCLYFERDVFSFPSRPALPYHPTPVSEEPEKRRRASREGLVQPTACCLLPAQGPFQPACLWACQGHLMSAAPLPETGTRTGALPAKEYWEKIFFLKRFYVYCPKSRASSDWFWLFRISSYLFHTWISPAFMEKTIWGHLVHTPLEAELEPWLSSQDCVMTNVHCDWRSLKVHIVWLICSQSGFVNRVANKIFFFHVNNNFLKSAICVAAISVKSFA